MNIVFEAKMALAAARGDFEPMGIISADYERVAETIVRTRKVCDILEMAPDQKLARIAAGMKLDFDLLGFIEADQPDECLRYARYIERVLADIEKKSP